MSAGAICKAKMRVSLRRVRARDVQGNHADTGTGNAGAIKGEGLIIV
jgi:hypothetical protein